jgi:hypothetical protein
MADRDTVFFLDDAEDEMGGFNDPILPAADPENDPDKDDSSLGLEGTKTKEPAADPDKDPESDKDPEPGPEEDKKPDTDKEDPKPEVKPAFDSDKAIAIIAKQNEQIAAQAAQIQKMSEPKKQVENLEPPEKPTFTADQWDDDPEGCNEALYNYRDQVKEFNGKLAAKEQESAAKTRASQLQAAHKESWDLSVDIMPELAGDEKARNAWAVIFNNQQSGFANDPNGPLKATQALRRFMKEKKLSFDNKPTPPKEDPAASAAKGAADEASRQKRVSAQGMHTGGKGGGKQAVQLTETQRAVCRKMNVSEKAYAETLAAMGGK